MLDVARRMAAPHSASGGWADVPSQLVSSRLERGARLGSTPSTSMDSTDSFAADSASRLERAESVMSTASATITKASTATIRKVGRTNASARPIRFTKSKKDPDNSSPSLSVERRSSRGTDATEYQSSPIFVGDQTQSTATTSFDTTLRSPSDDIHHSLAKYGHAPISPVLDTISFDLADPHSFFSDSFSGDDSNRSTSASTSRLASVSESLRIASASRRGSGQANSEMGASELHASEMSRSSSYQSAISSLAHSAEALAQASRASRGVASQFNASAKFASGAKVGLGIQTRVPISSSNHQQSIEPSMGVPRYVPGPSLSVVPEARESPYLGNGASPAISSPDMGARSALSISTTIPFNNEPVWGESSSVVNDGAADPTAGSMATFSFPSPVPSSASFHGASAKPTGSLSAKYPHSPGSAFHSSNLSMQSSASDMNGRHLFPSSKYSDGGLLQASNWSHAPPSSYGGSMVSSTGATSALGFSSLGPSSRDDMLHRLLLDQARVDCQEYGTMSLEQVAETKRELKHVERKVQSLRTKLKVEIKIRDAAVALRKAHRRTAASAHSPTSSINLAVSPTSPGFATTQVNGATLASSSSSSTASSSFAARSRALSISASEVKAEEDVSIATAKVDKVANELFKWTERVNYLRRRILEHQAATLSERVHHLESDRQAMEEKVPFFTTSTSFESLAPSASASAVGINRYRDAGHRYQQSADEPYIPRGPEDPLRHNRLESDLSAISGFSFLDASAPEKLRRLGEEVERKREMVRKLELDLDSAREAAQRRDETSGRLTQQLEEQSRERIRAVEELRTLREQMNRHEESARQAQAQAVQTAITDVEQKMQRQFEQGRSRDQEKEDALVNAKAEVMASQRAITELQGRLDATQEETRALRLRAEAAEKASDEHKRSLNDVQGESARQLTQGSQDLASLQAELQTVKAGQANASSLAADRAKSIAELEVLLSKVRDDLNAEKQARAQAEEQTTVTKEQLLAAQLASQKEISSAQSKAEQETVKLRELELAVGAERRIMAERDELFHAFERRLESAEQRLQEQDKRCARMLGKSEGREEMDDLLERIKAGASGVAKKAKTAGQDIAGLLSSLETHIGDLEMELTRANAQLPGSSRDSMAMSESSAHSPHNARLEASIQEIQRRKAEAERLESLLANQHASPPAPATKELERLQELEAELRALSERKDQKEQSEREGLQAITQLEAKIQTLSEENQELERKGVQQVQQLESKVEALEGRNRELEKQLRNASNPSSPAASVVTLPSRTSKSASPRSATFQQQNKGVGNLIDRFGGGRKVSPELRGEESPAMMQAYMRSVEGLRAMLPDLSAAAKGSADLYALRDAFQACGTSPPSPTAARSPLAARASLSTADLQAELDATAERLRSTLAISRAVIEMALESQADKDNSGNSEKAEQQETASQAQADALASQQALATRIMSLTAKVKEQNEREKRLKTKLAETKEQLHEARSAERAPSSPYGLTPVSNSMLGLSTSPSRETEPSLFGVSKSARQTSSNHSMRMLLSDKPSPISTSSYVLSGAMLAPPRSPSGYDTMPSPTRSNISAHSSPSIRYISPYAPPGFDARMQQRSLTDSRSMGTDTGTGDLSLSLSSNMMEASDSMSLRSGSSPSSTLLGLPSSAASFAGTSQSSASVQRGATDASHAGSAPNGMIKRTITLGMDVPQLVSRVRELERQLSQTASIRQRAERVSELETELREANRAYTKLLDRLDAERNIGTHQKVDMLNELNETQSKLQTTQAQFLRARSVSPLPSPLEAFKPLPPPKD